MNTSLSENKHQRKQEWVSLLLFAVVIFMTVIACFLIFTLSAPTPEGQTAGGKSADYLAFWAAGRLVLDNNALLAYDVVEHAVIEAFAVKREVGFLPWLNPPPFLLIIAPFSLFPFFYSHYIWSFFTAFLFGYTAYKIIPSRTAVLAVLCFPPVFLCFSFGQTGMLLAAFLGLFSYYQDKKPVLAGLIAALIIIKPQLGMVIPFVLLASANWKAFWSAVAAVIVLCFLPVILFTPTIWENFISSFYKYGALTVSLDHFLSRMQSFYGFFLYCDVPAHIAAFLQILCSGSLIALSCYIWYKPFSSALKGSIFIIASIAATPYFQIYDYPIMAIAGLYLWLLPNTDFEKKIIRIFIIITAITFLALIRIHTPIWAASLFPLLFIIIRQMLYERKSFKTGS